MDARLNAAVNFVTQRRAEEAVLRRTQTRLSSELKELKVTLEILEKVRALLNAMAESRRQQTLDRLEGIVTEGLQAVFPGSGYIFRIEPAMLRKQTTFRFRLSSSSWAGDCDIEESQGGGVVNLVAFLLSVSTQLMLDPQARTFIRDERFNNLSDEYVGNACSLLRLLAEKMDVQFVIVSHNPEFVEAADVAYKVSKNKDGETIAERIV